MDPVLDYIQDKGWEHQLSGDEVILKRCVFCGRETWKLYVNRKSRLYQCFRASCGVKGHISTLKKHVGDVIAVEGLALEEVPEVDFTERAEESYHKLIESDQWIRYLDDHGITIDAINRFKLGLHKQQKNFWLVYPSNKKGKAAYIKYRLLPFEKALTDAEKERGLTKFRREKGAPSILFNQDALDEFEEVIVTEGERDAITLLMNGFDNVVGTTGGAQTLKTEWYDALKEKTKIFLAFDSDEAGQKGARDSWASRLGFGKCYNIQIPEETKDITEFFMAGNTAEDFNTYLSTAQPFEITGIKPLLTILNEMRNMPEEEPVLPTPWESVNKLIDGGFRAGELITMSAPPGIGKTTMALQMSSLIAHRRKKPVLFFCQEMTYEKLARLFVCHSLDIPFYTFSIGDVEIRAIEFQDTPIYFGYSPRITPTQIQQTFLETRDRFGIEFFVFDNLHTLIREHDKVVERIGAASKMFKDLAMEMKVPILLIAQPRKMELDEVMYYYSIKGSSDIPADSDIVILLHRNRTKETEITVVEGEEVEHTGWRSATFESKTRFIVDKSRESAGGECKLHFDTSLRQFYSEDVGL
jgi:5S rRNA maturation endonuclease (ribonuclease M5)/archaellum biogenesis ATPase FlaH